MEMGGGHLVLRRDMETGMNTILPLAILFGRRLAGKRFSALTIIYTIKKACKGDITNKRRPKDPLCVVVIMCLIA